MSVARRLIAQRHLAVMLCVATLVLRLLIPSGYMIASAHGRMTVELCSGVAPHTMTAKMPGHGKSHDHGKAEMPCAFAGLSAASLGAVDPIQLAALIAFVMAIGLVSAVLPILVQGSYLRPPLRGPPSLA